MATATSEPFPLLGTAAEQLQRESNGHPRRRRRSSALGGEIRAGDTGPSISTSASTSTALKAAQQAADAPLTPTVPGSKEKRFSKRRKARSLMRRFKVFALRHTWVLPLILLIPLLAIYAVNPTDSNPIHRFIFLSYKVPRAPGADPDSPTQYGKGLWDIAFVSFYTIVLSFTREFIMQELLRPLARYCGLRGRGKQMRFMEQMYTALYFLVLGPAGLYVMSRTPVWYFDTKGMYANFPHKTHEACFKFYYLFQAAYWAQQAIVLVLGQEKARKDFKELVAHHIVSVALIALSYRFHFTYMGLAVYVTHDISDFFLATSKSLNYIDGPLMGPYFAFFMGTWIYLRHYLNIRILISLFTDFVTIGPFELDWEAGQFKCRLAQVITFSLLASLQALNLFWLFFILRIAYRFAFMNVAKDDRESDEDDETEEERAEKPLPENGKAGNGVAKGKSVGGVTKRR